MAETVFSSAADGRHNSGQQSSWANARGSVTSTSGTFSTTVSNYSFGVYNVKGGGRGSIVYSVVRSYFDFDLSSLSGTATSVDFKVYSDNLGATSTNGSTAYLVEATALAGAWINYAPQDGEGLNLPIGGLMGNSRVSASYVIDYYGAPEHYETFNYISYAKVDVIDMATYAGDVKKINLKVRRNGTLGDNWDINLEEVLETITSNIMEFRK